MRLSEGGIMVAAPPDQSDNLPFVLEHVSHTNPHALLRAMTLLRQTVHDQGQATFEQWRSRIHRSDFLPSALNLAYYLALRHYDLRPLQAALMPWGLSSLGRIEARVMPNLDAVIATLAAICHLDPASWPSRPVPADFFVVVHHLQHHTEELFGKVEGDRRVRMMVTLPSEAAENYDLIRDLIQRGTGCMRINCAHDTPDQWLAMIHHTRRASQETGKACKVLMDLGGPKPRTGEVFRPTDSKRVFKGDRIWLSREVIPSFDTEAIALDSLPPGIFQTCCMLPGVIDHLQEGATVWIDDGKIGAKVVDAFYSLSPEGQDGVLLEVLQVGPKGAKLKPEKGMNFPDTLLPLSPLTNEDLRDLDFVVAHADIVGYSFVQTAADIERLQSEIAARLQGRPSKLAIVAKIETPLAVQHLPELMVQAAGSYPFGVMIARGDLAIEIGYQRLAEIQEEILWLCEAAHIPVIWATQVLENLVKTGLPSRGEITDAAMAERAECVMLNKGPFITEAVTILDDVLTRMQAHQLKKTAQLRALHSW
jgi:pyruvate kinase